MATYNELRNFVIQMVPETETLRCYVSSRDDVQSEWILVDYLKTVLDSTRTDKLLDRWKDLKIVIQELHEKVWPDLKYPDEKVAKQNRKALKDLEEPLNLLDERTISTSTLCASVVVLGSLVKRSPALREKAYDLMRGMINSLARGIGGFSDGTMNVDSQGFVSSERGLWHLDPAESETLKKLWDVDLLNNAAFWVNSNIDRPHLADLIAFQQKQVKKDASRGDQRKFENLRPKLEEACHRGIRLLAETLHCNIHRLTVTQHLKRRAVASTGEQPQKKTQRLSTMEYASIVHDVSQKMIANQVTGMNHHL